MEPEPFPLIQGSCPTIDGVSVGVVEDLEDFGGGIRVWLHDGNAPLRDVSAPFGEAIRLNDRHLLVVEGIAVPEDPSARRGPVFAARLLPDSSTQQSPRVVEHRESE